MAFGWVIFLVLLCTLVFWHKIVNEQAQVTVDPDQPTVSTPIDLPQLSDGDQLGVAANRILEVNGQLKVNSSLIMNPAKPPENPVKGQVYYDEASNAPMYYDGDKFVAVANRDDVGVLQSASNQPSVTVQQTVNNTTVTVDAPDDLAQKEVANTFTQDNTFMQDVSVNGFTALQSTSIASLILGQPLSVASGGTGASSLASNGVIIGAGTGALGSVTAGSSGLCLVSTAGAPSFQACPGGGSPDTVTSTVNSAGGIAKFGAGNTLIDSLLSESGSTVSVAGNLALGSYNLQLGNNGFGSTLNTTSLTANRSITLPDASGIVCLQGSTSCGFVTGTPANFIQNQNSGAQAGSNYWVAGVGRADGGLIGPSFDTAASGTLTIGGNASTVSINDDTTVNGALSVALNSSSVNSPVLQLDQNGSGDTTIELKNDAGSSFYVGMDQSAGGVLRIGSSTSARTTTTVGTTAAGGVAFQAVDSQIIAKKVVTSPTDSGSLSSIVVHLSTVDGSASGVKVAIYDHDAANNRPGTLISATSTAVSGSEGWNTIPLSAPIASNTTYWIALNVEGSGTGVSYDYCGGCAGDSTSTYPRPFNNAWPATHGAPNNALDSQEWSFYMNVASGAVNDTFAGAKLFSMTDTGSITLQNSLNTTSAFQIQNAAGASVVNVDTVSGRLSVQEQVITTDLTVGGNIYVSDLDTSAAGVLSIGGTNATSITLGQDTTIGANKSLTITGGATGTRPASPTEGMVYYDTTTKQLITFANGKWQADRTEAVIVAASNSSQADKDAADYVADGNTAAANDGDQVQINAALTVGSGKKVVLLAGTYVVDSFIAVPNNTTLAGVGVGTLLTLPNAFNAGVSVILNQDSTTGAGVVIQDLRIDGNAVNQSAGNMVGIGMEGLGGGTRQGGKLANVVINNMTNNGVRLENSSKTTITGVTSAGNGGNGIALISASGNVVSGNVSLSNSFTGINLNGSSSNTIGDNLTQSNAGNGILLAAASNTNTVSGNNTQSNGNSGIHVTGSSHSSVTANTITNNASSGITVESNSTANLVSANKIHDNGGNTQNNGIFLWDADSNQIIGNSITDSSATNNNYAINAYDSTVDGLYLSGNALGTGSVNNLGTGTVFGGQVDAAGNYNIQPSGTIELLKNTNVTGTLTIGTTTQQGSLVINDGSSNTATIQVGNLAGNYTYTIPVTTGNDTFCMLVTANCGGVSTIGALDGGTANATGATITGSTLFLQSASGTNPGLVNTTTQTFAGNKTFNGILSVQDVTVGAGKSIYVTGGATGTRPGVPTEGMVYFDTTTKQLITYANGKWQASRSSSTKIVAASNSSQSAKDAADYVATGTADQTQINSALTAAAGGTVYLMEGTYYMSAQVSVPNNTTLSGAGPGTTLTIPNAQNATYSIVRNSDTSTGTNVTVRDLQIDGNRANQTGGNMNGISFAGMGAGTGSTARPGSKLTNLIIKNMRSDRGISLTGSNNIISGSTFQYNEIQAINLSGSNNVITGNTFLGNQNYTINVTGSYNTVTSNLVESSGADGIRMTGTYGTVTGNTVTTSGAAGIIASGAHATVTGNTASANNGVGIHISGDYGTVTGNSTSANTSDGIRLQTNYTVASGNNIDNNSQTGIMIYDDNNQINGNRIHNNGGDGIQCFATCNNNSIVGNHITDTAGSSFAIQLTNFAGTPTGNYLSNNIFSGVGASSINDEGVGTIYSNQRDGSGNTINRTQGGALTIGTNTAAASLTLQGGMVAGQLVAPTLSATVANVGTAGATTYRYQVTALDGTGETVGSTIQQTTTGNATLSGSNYNTITWTAVPGAYQYGIYKCSGAGCTPLKKTTVAGNATSFNDQSAGSPVGAAPGANTTGGATFAGGIQGSTASLSSTLTVAGATTLNGTLTGTGTALFKNTANSAAAFQIQDSSSVALFVADTSATKIVIRTLDVSYNLTVAGHIISGGSTPAIAADTAACTSPTVNVSGTDTAGVITVTTGTGCAAPGLLSTVTFATAFGTAPKVTLTPASAAAAGLNAYLDDASISTAGFKIGAVNTPADTMVYKWHYHALQ